MRTTTALLGVGILVTSSPQAQVANMPARVRQRLAAVGPGWGKDIGGNIEKTLEVYTSLLAVAPKAGIVVSKDLAYGPDSRHRLDLYGARGLKNAQIVVFLHGGAYVGGDREVNAGVYAHVATHFARQGLLGVNATYRLAPAAQWPAAAEDVVSVVKWLKGNAAAYGGDPGRIYLIGHSAGATPVASYVFIKELQPAAGPGVAGIGLMSGRYHFDPKPDDPNLRNFEAYFGTDASVYRARSPITHVASAAPLPTLIVIAEYDNPTSTPRARCCSAALRARPLVSPFHANRVAQPPVHDLPVQHGGRGPGIADPQLHPPRPLT